MGLGGAFSALEGCVSFVVGSEINAVMMSVRALAESASVVSDASREHRARRIIHGGCEARGRNPEAE